MGREAAHVTPSTCYPTDTCPLPRSPSCCCRVLLHLFSTPLDAQASTHSFWSTNCSRSTWSLSATDVMANFYNGKNKHLEQVT